VWQARLGERDARLTLTQHYQTLSGTLMVDGRAETLTDARMAGDRITFTASGQTFTGRVSAEVIEDGTARAGSAPPASWSARRVR
jgi:hypothetical protein